MTGKTGTAARGLKARGIKARLRPFLFLLGLVFLWPAAVNGDAFAFADSLSYARAADTAMQSLTGLHSERLSQRTAGESVAADPVAAGPVVSPPPPKAAEPRLVLYGRSVYFGVLPWLGVLVGSFWLPLVVQALLAGQVVAIAVRRAAPLDDAAELRLTAVVFAVLAISPLPWFVCFLMPDLLVGLAMLAAALLLVRRDVLTRVESSFLLAVCAAAALSHSSAVAVIGAMAAGGLLLAVVRQGRNRAVTDMLLLVAALLGIAGDQLFGFVTRHKTGLEPLRPPFLTARLFEDGPARRYHAERCDSARFVLCRHRFSGPVTAEMFLWSDRPGSGGFKALPAADRVRVAGEQGAFVAEVVRAYPVETATAMARNLGRLALRTDLAEFRPPNKATALMLSGAPASTAGDARMRGVVAAASALSAVLAVLSLVVMAAMLLRRRPSSAAPLALVVIGALLANDMICAWLSGPFARYQTRALWLLPLMALLLWASRRGVAQGSNAPPTA